MKAISYKLFASWLILLGISPFTAPFSTCDLTSVFGSGRENQMPAVPASHAAWTIDPTIVSNLLAAKAERTKPLPLWRASGAESASLSTFAAGTPSITMLDLRTQTALRSILRI
jgi:hypothetical protein